MIDLANKVEDLIISRGARCAFPINICRNSQAAHYTPSENDPLEFSRGDVVKLDVGVQINGFIADTAATVEISTSNWSDLIKASSDALYQALEMITRGIEVCSLGTTIENSIISKGFNPVKNLTGHSMERSSLHAGITVPNVTTNDRSKLKPGMAVAIEPFATNGKGEVADEKGGNIYLVINDKKLSKKDVNEFLSAVVKKYDHMPFAARWCATINDKYLSMVRKHWMHRNLRNYAILTEVSSGIVSQAEHSVLILDNEVIIYTK